MFSDGIVNGIIVYFSSGNCLLLVYRKAIDFFDVDILARDFAKFTY